MILMLLVGTGFVSASYYGGNYGYEYYDNYNYDHSYGNSRYNYNWQPNIVSIGSKNTYDDRVVYRSQENSYRSYQSYYPGYNGVRDYSKEYVLNRYYPYNSYVNEREYYESSSPYSYSQYTENNVRYLSRPEHYVALWSYR